jgi:hypothetical protein
VQIPRKKIKTFLKLIDYNKSGGRRLFEMRWEIGNNYCLTQFQSQGDCLGLAWYGSARFCGIHKIPCSVGTTYHYLLKYVININLWRFCYGI